MTLDARTSGDNYFLSILFSNYTTHNQLKIQIYIVNSKNVNINEEK